MSACSSWRTRERRPFLLSIFQLANSSACVRKMSVRGEKKREREGSGKQANLAGICSSFDVLFVGTGHCALLVR